MNNPEYILTDEMQVVIDAVKVALGIPVLNFQHGYVQELNQTLTQWEKSPTKSSMKFPLVWLAEPFTISRGLNIGLYGEADIDLYIINTTRKDWKAKERMDNNFKPVIYPIYREILNQFTLIPTFVHVAVDQIKHVTTNRYFWGDNNKSVLNDVIDCMKVSGLQLRIADKQNCEILSNF